VSENLACTSGDAYTTEGECVDNILRQDSIVEWMRDAASTTGDGCSTEDWYLFASPSAVRIF